MGREDVVPETGDIIFTQSRPQIFDSVGWVASVSNRYLSSCFEMLAVWFSPSLAL